MAGDVKGITIEFRGDTTKLDKALRTIQKETRSIDAELKNVNKALKFNPTSIELWRQKQDLLKRKISETEDKLKALKAAQKDLDAKGVDKNSAEYQKLRRQIIETESQLKTFKGQLKSVGNVNLRAASEQFKKLGTSLTNAGQALKGFSMAGAAVVATLGAMTYQASEAADELNTMSKVYGISTTELQKYAMTAEMVDVDTETIVKSQTKLKKSMMSAANGSKTNAAYFEQLGVSVYDANGNLRDSEDVFSDTLKALGKMENETERDAIAMQLMGKSAQELNPLIADNGETYKQMSEYMNKYGLEFIDQDTLDKASEFNDKLQLIKATGTLAYQTLGAKLAEYLLPALEKVVDLVGRFAEWLSNLDPRVVAIIGAIGGFVAVLSPLLIGLGKVAFAISNIMALGSKLVPLIGKLVSGFNPWILVLGAVVAAGVYLYKNWDTIKAKAVAFKNRVVQVFNEFKSKVTSIFNSVKNAIVNPIQSAIDRIRGIIDRIKSFFPIKLGKIFSGLKLPHLKLDGKFSIVPPSVPRISVDWYKRGGIFNSPSVIGVGEAGSEAVVPLDKLWSKLDAMQGGVVININGANASPHEIAQEVKRELIRETNRRRLAWQ